MCCRCRDAGVDPRPASPAQGAAKTPSIKRSGGTLRDFIILGVISGISYGLLALPLSMLFVATGTLDFALGAYAALSGLVCYAVGGPLGIAAGILSAVVAACVVGALSHLLHHGRRADHLTLVLASFGFAIFLESFSLSVFGEQPFVRHLFLEFWEILGVRVSPQAAINVVSAIAILGVTFSILYFSPVGRMMRASAMNPVGASLVGVPVRLVRASTFVVAGLLAGVAGVLYLYTAGVSYSSGLHLTLSGFAAAIIFGLRNPVRAFLGGIAIGVAESLSNGYLSSQIAGAAPLIFIFAVLVFQGAKTVTTVGRA